MQKAAQKISRHFSDIRSWQELSAQSRGRIERQLGHPHSMQLRQRPHFAAKLARLLFPVHMPRYNEVPRGDCRTALSRSSLDPRAGSLVISSTMSAFDSAADEFAMRLISQPPRYPNIMAKLALEPEEDEGEAYEYAEM